MTLNTGVAFSTTGLLLLGLACLAVHQAGYFTAWKVPGGGVADGGPPSAWGRVPADGPRGDHAGHDRRVAGHDSYT